MTEVVIVLVCDIGVVLTGETRENFFRSYANLGSRAKDIWYSLRKLEGGGMNGEIGFQEEDAARFPSVEIVHIVIPLG